MNHIETDPSYREKDEMAFWSARLRPSSTRFSWSAVASDYHKRRHVSIANEGRGVQRHDVPSSSKLSRALANSASTAILGPLLILDDTSAIVDSTWETKASNFCFASCLFVKSLSACWIISVVSQVHHVSFENHHELTCLKVSASLIMLSISVELSRPTEFVMVMLAFRPEVRSSADTFSKPLASTSKVQTSSACPLGWGVIPDSCCSGKDDQHDYSRSSSQLGDSPRTLQGACSPCK